jgi:S-adenosylmethionine hydrolase
MKEYKKRRIKKTKSEINKEVKILDSFGKVIETIKNNKK